MANPALNPTDQTLRKQYLYLKDKTKLTSRAKAKFFCETSNLLFKPASVPDETTQEKSKVKF